MARLAEYMLQFAKFLGEQERVHFVDIERGSSVLLARIEEVAAPKVERRQFGAKATLVIKRLHGVEGADWGDDPIGDLVWLRTGEGFN